MFQPDPSSNHTGKSRKSTQTDRLTAGQLPNLGLWKALREIDHYLTSQSAWLVNYAERHRAGLRVGTSITEGTANFLVNRRMNKF